MQVAVRFHDEYLDRDAPDEDGIGFAAERGWVYLTADHGPGVRGGPLLRAVFDRGAKCFILIQTNHLPAGEKAEVVRRHVAFIGKIADKRSGPFAYRLYRDGRRKNVSLP